MNEYQSKLIRRYAALNKKCEKGCVLFTGSSLMEQFPVAQFTHEAGVKRKCYNRGVGGFTTYDFLENIGVQALDLKPSVVFINIGTNDLGRADYTLDALIANYRTILKKIIKSSPKCKVYLMSYYPMCEALLPETLLRTRNNRALRLANEAVEALAGELDNCSYIDVNRGLTDENGGLRREFTEDGMHFSADGYRTVFERILPYIE